MAKVKDSDKVSPSVDTCLIVGCNRDVKSRGLCAAHYAVARAYLKQYQNGNWSYLESKGMAVPAGRVGGSENRDMFQKMLSEGK